MSGLNELFQGDDYSILRKITDVRWQKSNKRYVAKNIAMSPVSTSISKLDPSIVVREGQVKILDFSELFSGSVFDEILISFRIVENKVANITIGVTEHGRRHEEKHNLEYHSQIDKWIPYHGIMNQGMLSYKGFNYLVERLLYIGRPPSKKANGR